MGLFKNKDMDDSYIEQEFSEDTVNEVFDNDAEHAEEQALHEEPEFTHSYEESGEDEQELRREERRKRRIRNELLTYLTAVLVLAVVSGGVFMGVKTIHTYYSDRAEREESLASEATEGIQDLVESMLASESELPTEVIIEVTPEEKLDEYIDTVIAGMTLEEKVYGLVITSPEELTGVGTAVRAGTGTQTSLESKPVGGLVYYRKNMESADQLKEMLTNTMSYSKYPVFLAVNEGGDSYSSVQNSAVSVPEVTRPGNIADGASAYNLGSTIGGYLSELHFNVNFAPTADILYIQNAAVSDYCFGGDAMLNAELVSQYVTGLEEQGISATLKSFPGTGHLSGSTENGAVSTDRSKEEFKENFGVFKAGIDAGADFVMVSHVVASELSGGMDPCSMSADVVTDILRGELGFRGVIITEPMTRKAITEYYTADEAAVAALKAGCDMILLPEDLETAVQGILNGVSNGSVSEARINDSLKRVFRVKYADKLSEFSVE